TTCSPSSTEQAAVPTWQSSVKMCEGFNPSAPRPALTQCIHRSGEHPCPPEFSDRSVRYHDFDDSRSCSGCSCTPQGQACTIELQICSVGFFEATLESGEECLALNSSDGDGVTLLSSNLT